MSAYLVPAFLLVIIVILLFRWYKTIYQIDKHISRFPGPKTVPIFGNALQMGNTKTIVQNFFKFQNAYGGVYVLKVGPTLRNLVVTDLKLTDFLLKSNTLINKSEMYAIFETFCGSGLVTSSGERWRKHRKLLNPAFQTQTLEQYIQVLESATNVLTKKLQNEATKEFFDVSPIISLCTLDMVLESIMGTSVKAQENVQSEYAHSFHEVGRIIMERTYSPLKIFDFIYRFTEDYQIQRKVVKIMRDYSISVIKQRRDLINSDQKVNKKRSTLLDLLLKGTVDEKYLTDDDIIAEVQTFIIAGSDTTTAATSFALYCLAKYLEEQKKVVEELTSIFGDDMNRPATYQDLQDMKYLELFIKETLRLYPPLPFISRQLEKNVEYDGGTLPKGLSLIVFIFGIHRDPQYFPDPEKFDPERFLSDDFESRVFLPFSAGVRNCIGQKFAMLQMKSILSKILRHFEVLPTVPEHNVVLGAEPVLKSINGILIRLQNRKF